MNNLWNNLKGKLLALVTLMSGIIYLFYAYKRKKYEDVDFAIDQAKSDKKLDLIHVEITKAKENITDKKRELTELEQLSSKIEDKRLKIAEEQLTPTQVEDYWNKE